MTKTNLEPAEVSRFEKVFPAPLLDADLPSLLLSGLTQGIEFLEISNVWRLMSKVSNFSTTSY